MYWKFKLIKDYEWKCKEKTNIIEKDLDFYDDENKLWLQIFENGIIRVKEGYAWDGCSLKFNILDLFFLGIPDGIRDIETGKAKTYYASLVHDALYQFMDHDKMPFKRKDMDRFFLRSMKERKFKMRYIYYFVVRVLGQFYHCIVKIRNKLSPPKQALIF